MSDALEAPQEGVEEVVQTEAEQAEASEATESTEGLTEQATAEGEGEASAEPEEAPEEKERKSRSERRREAKERQQRELAEATAAREAAERRLSAIKQAAEQLPVPKQDDFPSYEEFQAALSAYHSVKMLDSREAQAVEAEAAAQRAAIQRVQEERKREDAQNWAAHVSEGRSRYQDFDAVVLADHAPFSDDLAEMIVGSEVAADVAYHIGKNPQIAAQISQLDPVEMARAIGRLEATLIAPQQKKTTSAPDPISPVKGGGSAVKNPGDMSPQEFANWREKGGGFS